MHNVIMIIYCFLLINAVNAELVIGNFEKKDSFKQFWRAPKGVWGAGGLKIKQTELQSSRGRYALEVKIKGREKKIWPYFEYRFPKNKQDLSPYKYLKLDIVNKSEENKILGAYFLIHSTKNKDKIVRIDFSNKLKPGLNKIQYKLSARKGGWIKSRKDLQPINWKNVDSVHFYFDCPKEDFDLIVDNVRFTSSYKEDTATTTINNVIKVSDLKSGKLQTKFVLDGKLTEWQGIPPNIIKYKNNGTEAKEVTRMQIAYDRENLYLSFLCSQNKIAAMKKVNRKRDGHIWNDDNLEIMIQNLAEGEKNYYQMAVNVYGNIYDGKIINSFNDSGWNSRFQAVVDKGKNFWTCEILIPWSTFRFPGGRAPSWRLNVFRNNTTAKEQSALSPTLGSYHNPSKFVPLKLQAPDLKTYCVNVKSFDVQDLSLGTNDCELVIEAYRNIPCTMRLKLKDNSSGNIETVKLPFSLKNGINKVKIPFEVKRENPLTLQMFIENPENITIAETDSKEPKIAPPLNMRIVSPNYRDNIYSGQNIKEILVSATINIPENMHKKFKIAVVLKDDKKQIIARKELQAKRKISITFDPSKLGAGDYCIEVSLKDSGVSNISVEKPLKILPYKPGQIVIDSNNFISINNKPFFLIGLYNPILAHAEKLSKIGFNTGYRFVGWRNPQNELEVIDEFFRKGLYSFANIGASIVQSNKRKAKFSQMKPKLDKWVNVLKNAKGLLAYEMLDEPNIHYKGSHIPYLKAYDYLKQIDPYHPVSIVQCGEIYMPAEHAQFTDIYDFDYYPGYELDGNCLQPLNSTAMRVRSLRKKLTKACPIFPILQGYDRAREWNKYNTGRFSNYQETRSLIYSSIAEGATGIWFWCYNEGNFGCMAGRPNWLGVKKNIQELNILMPVLTSSEAKKKLLSSAPDKNKFHCTIKDLEGSYYIIAASTNENDCSVKFSGAALDNISSLKVLGENREIKVNGSKFADLFSKYQVHIYTNAAEPLKIPNILRNQQECLNYKQEIRKRNIDNILHQKLLNEKYKIKVQSPTSSRNNYFIFDGLRNSAWYMSSKDLPGKLSINMETPAKINRIVILTSTDYIMKSPIGVVKDFTLQIKVNNKWETIKEVKNNKEIKIVFEFAAKKVSAIRLVINKTTGHKVSIDEVEAYYDKND